jgi:hypothetical protein
MKPRAFYTPQEVANLLGQPWTAAHVRERIQSGEIMATRQWCRGGQSRHAYYLVSRSEALRYASKVAAR